MNESAVDGTTYNGLYEFEENYFPGNPNNVEEVAEAITEWLTLPVMTKEEYERLMLLEPKQGDDDE